MFRGFLPNAAFKLIVLLIGLAVVYAETQFPLLNARIQRRIVNQEFVPDSQYQERRDTFRSRGSDYELERIVGQRGNLPSQFLLPTHVALDGDFVFVTDYGNRRIQKFYTNGEFLEILPLPDLIEPVQFQVYQDQYFVVDAGCPCIRVYSRNYEPLFVMGEAGVAPGKLNHPNSLVVDTRGMAWVADDKNNRIEIFSLEKVFNRPTHYFMNIDEYQPEVVLQAPRSMAWWPSKQEYFVVDAGTTKILVFDQDGNYIREVVRAGSESNRVVMPQALAIDEEGNLYIGDQIAQRVLKISGSGTEMGEIGYSSQFSEHLRLPPSQERQSALVRNSQFDPGDSVLNFPLGLAVSPTGGLWVADWGNNQVKLFTVDYFRKGFEAYKQQQFLLAIQYFNRCHERNPAYHLVEFYLSMCHYYLGELNPVFEKRLEWYAKARSHFESLLLKGKIGRFEDDDLERRAAYYLARVGSVLTDR
jgi:sugar lactone lactonase YvrE